MLRTNEVFLLVNNTSYTSISFSQDASTVKDYFCPIYNSVKLCLLEKLTVPQLLKEDVNTLQEMYILHKPNYNMKICYGHNMHYDLYRQLLVRHFVTHRTCLKFRSLCINIWFLPISTFNSLEQALI